MTESAIWVKVFPPSGTAQGWASTASGVVASGGTESTFTGDGTNGVLGQDYKVHTFTANGTLTVSQGGEVDFLLVGGGGPGAASNEGSGGGKGPGGGGGGFLELFAMPCSVGALPVVVGAGGVFGSQAGGSSTFLGIGAPGGGAADRPGGSGGGKSASTSPIPGIAPYGSNGGLSGTSGLGQSGGCGGGAGGPGSQVSVGSGVQTANVGPAKTSRMGGTAVSYAGGGGGGGGGGWYGWGAGVTPPGSAGTNPGLNATQVGGGGGGSGANGGSPNGGDGFRGVVIVRYKV